MRREGNEKQGEVVVSRQCAVVSWQCAVFSGWKRNKDKARRRVKLGSWSRGPDVSGRMSYVRCYRRLGEFRARRLEGCVPPRAGRHQVQSHLWMARAPFLAKRASLQNAHGVDGTANSSGLANVRVWPDCSKGGVRILTWLSLGSWHTCPKDSLELLRPFGVHFITRFGPLQLGDEKVINRGNGDG